MTQTTYAITPNQLLQEEHTLYDIAAERAFLALLMKQPQLIIEAERKIPSEWLHLDINSYVYKVMLFIYRQASVMNWPLNFDPIQMLFVARQAGQQFEKMFMDRTEGMDHVRAIELLKGQVHADQFMSIVHTLSDRAKRVMMYREARAIQTKALSLSANPVANDVAIMAETTMSTIAFAGTGVSGHLEAIGEGEQDFFTKTSLTLQNPNEHLFNVWVPGFPFWMDLMGGGFPRKGLSIVAARPKVGKSTLLLNIALFAAFWGIPVFYMDTEMSREEMYSRCLSWVTGVDENLIKHGALLEEVNGQLQYRINPRTGKSYGDDVARLKAAPFTYHNATGLKPEQIPGVVRQFRNQKVGTRIIKDKYTGVDYEFSRPGIVIYDWMKIPDVGALRDAREDQLLGQLATTLKDTAKSNDLPIIAGAQNNREAINADRDTFGEAAEGMVANSDRLMQFCTQLCVMRNLDNKEQDILRAAGNIKPLRLVDDAWKGTSNELLYNQALYIVVQRAGGNYTRGIPMYLKKGTAQYTEMYYATDDKGHWLKDSNGRYVESDARKHFHKMLNDAEASKGKGPMPKQNAVGTPVSSGGETPL